MATAPSQLRQDVVAAMQRLQAAGLNHGSAGNASVRTDAGFLITPTGVTPGELEPGRIVAMTAAGAALDDDWLPSSEWRFHRDIYQERQEVGAVVHAHSTYATTLACLRREIPAFHYMVARIGGDNVRCGGYATFGTRELSQQALTALQGRQACLLANHGMIALGKTLEAAVRMAVEVEELARQYVLTLQLGGATLLTSEEMATVIEKFETYGQQKK